MMSHICRLCNAKITIPNNLKMFEKYHASASLKQGNLCNLARQFSSSLAFSPSSFSRVGLHWEGVTSGQSREWSDTWLYFSWSYVLAEFWLSLRLLSYSPCIVECALLQTQITSLIHYGETHTNNRVSTLF